MKAQPSSVRVLPEQTILSAWREQLQQASSLSHTLSTRQSELLPRFAAYYLELQRLPRRMRRGLQRQFRRVRLTHRRVVRTTAPACPVRRYGNPDTGAHPTRLPRKLLRKWERSVAGVALLLALGQMPALAATINVDGTNCTLVDAITAANTNNAIGLCKAGHGADRLVLRPGSTHTLTTINNSTPYGATGLPVVTSAITIVGNGSTITRASGTPSFRILAVSSTGVLTIQQTTLRGGRAPSGSSGGGVFNRGKLILSNSTVSGNTTFLSGGGVYTSNGSVTLINTTVSGNEAGQGGGVYTTNGTAILTNSTVAGNRAGAGGGVYTSNGTAILTNSTVFGNRVITVGGGVSNTDSSTLTVTSSTISGNSAFHGGGISSGVGNNRVNLTNSTVSGNSATRYGGGIDSGTGILTLTSSTVAGNTARVLGGGVHSAGRYDNLRSDVVLSRSLISGNVATFGTEIYQRAGGVVTSTGFNLFGHDGAIKEHALRGPGLILVSQSDIIASALNGNRPTALASILNVALANNGGPTQTHALVPGSPAIEGAGSCPSNDQRGIARPQDGDNDGFPICDIGAFELAR